MVIIPLLSVESVAMLIACSLLFIFLLSCIVCSYFIHRCYEDIITTNCNELDQHSTSEGINNPENNPTHDIATQIKSLTSNPTRRLEVIIEHQREEYLSMAELKSERENFI